MKLRTIRIAAVLILAAGCSTAHAQQNLIWDNNGTGAGFHNGAGTYADGVWNNTNTLWTTDPTGLTGHVAWNDAAAPPDNAIFRVAGASGDPGNPDPLIAKDAVVTLSSGSRPASNLTVDNGWVQLNTAVSGTNVNVGTGNVTVKTGAKLEVDNSLGFFEIAHTAGAGDLVIDGGTIINSNTAAGTTFYSGSANMRFTTNGGFINVLPVTNTGSIFGGATAGEGSILYDGGTTTNGGAGVVTKIGPGELRAQNASHANNTFAKLLVKGTGMLTSGNTAFGIWRLGFLSGPASFETSFGAVPLTVKTDAIELQDGGTIGASVSLSLHPNRGVTIGSGGGGSWGSGGANVIITGPLSGTGTLITTGTAGGGIAINNAASTWSGAMILRSGFVIFNESMAATNLSGDGFLTATPTQLFGTANIAPGKVFTAGSDGASSSFDGRLTGAAGTFRKVGAGTLTLDTILSGAESTNLGTVDIQGGSIQFATTNSGFGDATTVNIASGATLDMNSIGDGYGGLTGAGNVTNQNATTGTQLTLRGAGTYVHSGTISGVGVVNVTGAPVHAFKGSQTFAGANTYSGGTNVQGGRLLANNTSGSATGTGAVNVTGGLLAGTGSVDGAITVGTGTFTYGAAPNAKTLNTAGHVGGGVGHGTGSVLTANSTVTVNSGGSLDATLGAPGNSDRLKVTAAGGLNLSTGGLMTIKGNSSAITGTYTVLEHNGLGSGTAASLNINNATGFEMTGGITDTGTAFTVTMTNTAQNRTWATNGNGNWSSAAADAANWTGGNGGQPNGPGATVTMGATGGATSHTVTITDSDKSVGTLNLNSDDYTIASGVIIQWLVTAAHSGSAGINVAAGNHTISAPLKAMSNTNVSVASGLTLNVTGGITNDGGLRNTGAGNLAITSTDYDKIVSNNSILENSGGGAMTITISGTGVAGSPGTVGPIGIVSNNSTGSIVNSGSGSLTIANSGTGIFVNQGTVSNTAGGTLTVNGTTTTSATAYGNTTLSTTTPGVVGVFSNTGSGTLDINGNIVAGSGVKFSNSTTGTMTVDGVISGGLGLGDAGNVYIDGPGTVLVTGVNTNSGRKILKAGKMEITQDRALGAIPLAQGGYYDDITFDGGTLLTTATANLVIDGGRGIFVKAGGGTIETANASGIRTEFSGTIFGTGTLNKTGNRQLRLGGNSFLYTGNVNINQGTLAVVNTTGTATGTGPVAVNSTGTLSGTGRVGGLVTVNSGGEISPALGTGAGGIGSITLGAGLTLNSGSLFDLQLGAPSSADLINVTGGTTTINGGTLNLTDTGGLAAGTYPIIDYVGTLLGSASNLAFGTTPGGFSYSVQDTGSLINLIVSAGLTGDFNEDGKVDAADYVIWRKNETANSPLPNDNGLGNQAARFDLWKANFGNMTMPGGGSGSGQGAVPEPTSVALLLVGLVAASLRCARR